MRRLDAGFLAPKDICIAVSKHLQLFVANVFWRPDVFFIWSHQLYFVCSHQMSLHTLGPDLLQTPKNGEKFNNRRVRWLQFNSLNFMKTPYWETSVLEYIKWYDFVIFAVLCIISDGQFIAWPNSKVIFWLPTELQKLPMPSNVNKTFEMQTRAIFQ